MGKLKNGYAQYNKVDFKKNEEIHNFGGAFFLENNIEGFIQEVLPNGGFNASVWL